MHKVYITSILSLCLLLFSCQNEQAPADQSAETTVAPATTEKSDGPKSWEAMSIEEQQLNKIILQGLGGFLIKTVTLESGTATLDFAATIEETNISSPDKELTPYDYWSSAGRIEKVFPLLTANLFNQLPFLNELHMNIPFQDKLHRMSISRKEYETFAGKSTEEIKKDQQNNFNARFINNIEGRKQFLDRFVKIQ